MNPKKAAQESRRPPADLARKTWLTLVCFFLALNGYASDPSWWSSSGAVSGTPNPNAVANQGQLKQFTVAAVNEMNADLQGGAGTALNGLVAGWRQDYATNGYATNANNPTRPYKPADFQAVNVGQLKYIASLIYAQLQQAGYTATLPSWIVVNPSTDSTATVLGQLKSVFNFDLALDSDGSGLPIWWEQEYFQATGVNANALAGNGTGLTILQSYQQGINPNDPFNGQLPTLNIAGGNGQTGGAGGFVSQALAAQVIVSGQPVPNAQVSFAVAQNGGQVQATISSQPAATLTVNANSSGIARVFFLLPATPGAVCQVSATTGTSSNQATATFTETAGAAGSSVQNAACSTCNLTCTLEPDGSELFTWQNNTDDPVPIWNKDANGTVTLVTTVPGGTTSYQFTPQ